jgi:hypothetical protein
MKDPECIKCTNEIPEDCIYCAIYQLYYKYPDLYMEAGKE